MFHYWSNQIPEGTLDSFLTQVEEGYQIHDNHYHNSTHAADVLQTVHVLLLTTKLTVSEGTAASLGLTSPPSSGLAELPGAVGYLVCCHYP